MDPARAGFRKLHKPYPYVKRPVFTLLFQRSSKVSVANLTQFEKNYQNQPKEYDEGVVLQLSGLNSP